MVKIINNFLIFLISLLLVCSCADKKLPLDSANLEEAKILYEFFVVLEKNEIDSAFYIITQSGSSDLVDEMEAIFCSYTEKVCPNYVQKSFDPGEKLTSFILKLNAQDTTEIISDFDEIETLLTKVDHTNLIKFYFHLLTRTPTLYEIDKVRKEYRTANSDLDLAKILTYVGLNGFTNTSNQEEDLAASFFELAAHTILENLMEHKFPRLTSRIYSLASVLCHLGDLDDDLDVFFSSSAVRIDSVLPDGLWKYKLQSKLNYLLMMQGKKSFRDLEEYYEQELSNSYGADIRIKNEVLLETSYVLYKEVLRHGHNSDLAIDLLKEALEGIVDKCSGRSVYITEYLNDLLLYENRSEEALQYLNQISDCTNLNSPLLFISQRIEEHYLGNLCIANDDLQSCYAALKKNLSNDTLINSIYGRSDQLHLSSHYAIAAKKKFKYLKKIEELENTEQPTEEAFAHLQNTKYRIFNYRNNYDKIYSKSIRRKINLIEEKINALDVEIDQFVNFGGNTEAYIQRISLQLESLSLRSDADPEAVQQEVNIRNASADDLRQKIIDLDLQAFEFYQYENELRLFVQNPDTFYHEIIPLDGELRSMIDRMIEQQRLPYDEKKALGSTRVYIYERLLKKHINPSYPNVIMIPDGILNGISFETLMESEGQMLMEDYNFSYAYGINNVNTWNSRSELISNLCYLSFSSKSTIDDRSKKDYPELRGAVEEVKEASAIFEDEEIKIFQGKECTVDNLKKSLSYDIAHIATHAFSDPKHSNGNYFITRSNNQTVKTYGYELENVNASSKLAVLSACETGIGKYELGEGVFSLSRNLQQAGVPSVIKTLWQVPDTYSATLMQFFYYHLSEGKTVALALSQAKKDLIVAEKIKDPYFWSGYVLEGNPLLSFHRKE